MKTKEILIIIITILLSNILMWELYYEQEIGDRINYYNVAAQRCYSDIEYNNMLIKEIILELQKDKQVNPNLTSCRSKIPQQGQIQGF